MPTRYALVYSHSLQGDRGSLRKGIARSSFAAVTRFAEVAEHDGQSVLLLHSVLVLANSQLVDDSLALRPCSLSDGYDSLSSHRYAMSSALLPIHRRVWSLVTNLQQRG